MRSYRTRNGWDKEDQNRGLVIGTQPRSLGDRKLKLLKSLIQNCYSKIEENKQLEDIVMFRMFVSLAI